MKRFKGFVKEEKGQSLVEFSLVVPLLLLILVGIVNIGIIMYTYLNMNMTVQEASRLAGLGNTDDEVVHYVKNHAYVDDPNLILVSISPDGLTRKSGDYVTVTIHYSLDHLTPIFDQIFSSVQLSAKSTVRVE